MMKEPLHYLATGPNDGRAPLIFIHGDFSNGKLSWSRQIEPLAASRRLIVIDRRGNGKSPKAPAPYTIAQDAEDVIEIADSLASGAGFHLVGHSYGGLIALEVACRAPKRLRSLHLIEPPYLSLIPDDPDARALTAAVSAVAASAPGLSAEAVTEGFFDSLLGAGAGEALRTKSVWPHLVREAERFLHQEPAAAYPPERLREVPEELSVTLYAGGGSHPALVRASRRLASLRGWPVLVFPEAGHDVQRTGEPFNRALLAAIGSEARG